MTQGAEEARLGNDICDDWRQDIKQLFQRAIAQCDTEDELATFLVTQWKKASGTWHCIVGKSFGSAVACEEGRHFCEQIGQFLVEVWCCG